MSETNNCLLDEIEALKLIYEENLFFSLKQPYEVKIQLFIDNRSAVVQFQMPSGDSDNGFPLVSIQARWISADVRKNILKALFDKFENTKEGPMIYSLTEFCREKLEEEYYNIYGSQDDYSEEQNSVELSSSSEMNEQISLPQTLPNIVLGEVIVDKKSVFQGIAMRVNDANQVDNLIEYLRQDRKIASATHRIAAWRIGTSNEQVIQDWEDDGEKGAGHRLLQLLINTNSRNVLLVVCRWFGGILLGPVRFHYIQQAAKSALERMSAT